MDWPLAETLAEFAATSLLIELTPGPNMAYLAALTLSDGRRVGLAAVAGVCAGLGLVGILVAFGLAALIDGMPLLYGLLRYAGIAFLLYLAWDAWSNADKPTGESVGLGTAFWRATLTNVLNPKSALFYVSVLPLFLDRDRPDVTGQTLVLAGLYVGIATTVHAVIVLFADRLRPYLVSGPHETVIRRVLAASLGVVAIWLFFGTRR